MLNVNILHYLKKYSLIIDFTNYFSSSIGAEAREILNGKGDHSYIAYMNDKIFIKSKLLQDILVSNFLLIAGYLSSMKYGVNSSNVYDFRRRLGFSKIVTYGNLKYEDVPNPEMCGFSSVYDESMIDSLIS